MKKRTLQKLTVLFLALISVTALLSLSVLAADGDVVDTPAETAEVPAETLAETPAEEPVAETPAETAAAVIKGIFSGTNLALLGAALAVALPCMGSAKGVGIVGEASGGLLSEDPSLFGKALALQALPMTQGVYGLVASFLTLAMLGLFGNIEHLTSLSYAGGAYYLMASLPIALAGYYSAVRQGRVSAAGVQLLSKRPSELGKAITSAALVETYAIFSLLVTLLLVFFSPFNA